MRCFASGVLCGAQSRINHIFETEIVYNANQKIGPEYAKIYTYLHEDNFQKAYNQLVKLKNNIDSYDFSDEKKQDEISSILWHEYFIKAHTGEHDAAKTALKKQKEIDLAKAKKSKNTRSVKNTESGALWAESHLEIMKGNYDVAKTKLENQQRQLAVFF